MIQTIFETLTTVFTEFIPLLGGSFVDMFKALFLTAGENATLNELGILMVTIIGVSLVIGIFGVVFRLFNRFRKSVR